MRKFWRLPLDAGSHTIPIGEVKIIKDRCKGCGFCIEFCPNKILEFSPEFNAKGYHPPRVTSYDECVNCDLCEIICPEFAIFTVLVEKRLVTREDILKHTERLQPGEKESHG
ncbi:MAG: 4Fe-4S binding protein [Proteobacteria bacterium]|nr:4Fe-4S binding protein [Pseudomonadota bacterium]